MPHPFRVAPLLRLRFAQPLHPSQTSGFEPSLNWAVRGQSCALQRLLPDPTKAEHRSFENLLDIRALNSSNRNRLKSRFTISPITYEKFDFSSLLLLESETLVVDCDPILVVD